MRILPQAPHPPPRCQVQFLFKNKKKQFLLSSSYATYLEGICQVEFSNVFIGSKMSRLLNFIQSHLLPKQVSLLQASSVIISELPLKSKFIKDLFSKKTLLLLMECKLLYLTMPSRQLVIICSYLCM